MILAGSQGSSLQNNMKSILTPFQKEILDIICQEKYITDNFWLAGGTALSEFYLQHRLSEDFDFFTDNEISLDNLKTKLDKVLKNTGAKSVEYRTIQMAKIFFLKGSQKEVVKTDFNYFPFPKFGTSKYYNGLKIASLIDIAISKIDAILNRDKARDFVDFYFIQKTKPFDLKFLIKKSEDQAGVKTDPLFLASCFLKAEKVKDYPKILVPFNKEEMVAYFIDLASQQKSKIIK